jgi:hypothetical protein
MADERLHTRLGKAIRKGVRFCVNGIMNTGRRLSRLRQQQQYEELGLGNSAPIVVENPQPKARSNKTFFGWRPRKRQAAAYPPIVVAPGGGDSYGTTNERHC